VVTGVISILIGVKLQKKTTYCWWLKSAKLTSWGKSRFLSTIIYKVYTIQVVSRLAGFLNHQQYWYGETSRTCEEGNFQIFCAVYLFESFGHWKLSAVVFRCFSCLLFSFNVCLNMTRNRQSLRTIQTDRPSGKKKNGNRLWPVAHSR